MLVSEAIATKRHNRLTVLALFGVEQQQKK